MSRLAIAIEQLDATRRYTRMVLSHTPHERWFEMPAGCPSHVAWQVGHLGLAMAQHAWRTVCGRELGEVLPAEHAAWFGKGSAAVPDAAMYPTPGELTERMELIYDESVAALGELDESVMTEPATHATGLIRTKFDLVMYNARHEMLHVGQIGLIRRLLGLPPYR